LAALGIRWESVDRVSTGGEPTKVVTGEGSESGSSESQELALKWGNKPIVVYVCDEAAGCEGFDKLEEVILKDENVALGMKAFRTVKMHPDHADVDPVTKGKGKDLPRMLVIEPTKMKVTVIEGGKLKASGLFKAMQKAAGKVYKENLKKIVKTHKSLLTEQDQLANAIKALDAKIARLEDEKKQAKAKEELEEVRKDLAAITKKQKDLWKLTPKKSA
jgi:hypothetical protein